MAEQKIEQPSFTLEDVLRIVKESTVAMAAEMKKPSALEQQKLDEDRNKRQKELRMRLVSAQEEERERTKHQSGCRHQKVNGDSAWGGQVNSDGYARLICLECGKVAPEVKAPIEWVQSGINAQDPQNRFMKALTLEQITAWQKATGGPKPKAIPKGIEPLSPELEAKIAAMP